MDVVEQPTMTGEEAYKHVSDRVLALSNPHLAHQLPKRRRGSDQAIDFTGNRISKVRIRWLSRTESEVVQAYINEVI